jgi:hypothetical protein
VAASGELGFPQFFAGFDVEGAEEWIESSGDEDEAACGDDRTTKIDRARRGGRLLAAEILHSA